MLKFELSIFTIYVKLFCEDGEFHFVVSTPRKKIIDVEKSWVRTFRCSECGTKVADENQIVQLCDHHRDEFVSSWEERWTRKR